MEKSMSINDRYALSQKSGVDQSSPYFENLVRQEGQSIEEAQSLVMKIIERAETLTRQDVKKWRLAWQQALFITNPKRLQLHDIYRDILIDNHLHGAIQNRQLQLLKQQFKIIDRDTGEPNDDAHELLRVAWFRKFIGLSQESKFFGHSLIQFGNLFNGQFKDVELINRRHVIPEKHLFVRNPTDTGGFDYLERPWCLWTIPVGGKDDLGLLLKVAPQAIAKKNMTAFWDSFGEIFGIPIRIAKTMTKDTKERDAAEQMLKKMGSKAFAVLPPGTELSLVESKQTDSYKVFDMRIQRANSEMSKAILGQTMTMDDGSSRAQAEVHEHVAEDVIQADMEWMRDLINDTLFPFLITHGYQLEGLRFEWDQTKEIPLDQQLEIDQFLLNNFTIEQSYFEEKYNVPLIAPRLIPVPASGGGGDMGK